MLVTQLKHHFPARFPEWMNSGIMASWGAYVLLHPDVFSNSPSSYPMAGLESWTFNGYPTGTVWGIITLVVGIVRACALFVNGAYSRTPMIRLTASAVSAFVWSQLIIGLLETGISNVNVVVYSWLLIIDVASAYRAGMDTAIAEESRRASKEGGRVRNVTGGTNGIVL